MKELISQRLEKIKPSMTLAITAKANELMERGLDVVAFGVGEPDFDTPQPVKDAAIEAINKGNTKYTPVMGVIELKELICEKLKRDNDLDYSSNNIIVNSGAKHSLSTAFQAILNPEEEVILAAPYWVSYPEIIKLAGGVPVIIDTKESNNFKITAEELEGKITDRTKAVLLNSPSNPTGSVYSREELEKIADIALKHRIFVISDEIYEKLVYDENKHISIAQINDEIKELTILINGMSKDFAMTGWRLGYTAGNCEVIKAMGIIQGHAISHPSSITQYAGIGALKCDKSIFENMHKEYDERRNYILKRLSKIGDLSYIYPQGTFYVFINVSKLFNKTYKGIRVTNSLELADALLDIEQVALVPGIAFGLDTFVRISYATSMKEIEKGLDRIENFIKKGV